MFALAACVRELYPVSKPRAWYERCIFVLVSASQVVLTSYPSPTLPHPEHATHHTQSTTEDMYELYLSSFLNALMCARDAGDHHMPDYFSTPGDDAFRAARRGSPSSRDHGVAQHGHRLPRGRDRIRELAPLGALSVGCVVRPRAAYASVSVTGAQGTPTTPRPTTHAPSASLPLPTLSGLFAAHSQAEDAGGGDIMDVDEGAVAEAAGGGLEEEGGAAGQAKPGGGVGVAESKGSPVLFEDAISEADTTGGTASGGGAGAPRDSAA